jgi:hypothetical protein
MELSLLNSLKVPFYESEDEPFIRRLQVGFDTWRENVYKGIFRSLSELGEKVDLTAPLYRFGSLTELANLARGQAKGSKVLEAYFRIEAFLKEYRGVVRSIMDRPASKVVEGKKNFRLETHELNSFRFSQQILHYHHIEKSSIVGRAVLPTSFVASVQEETYNIHENQFLVSSVRKIAFYLETIISGIENYLEAKHNIYQENITHSSRSLPPSIHMSNLAKQIDQHEKIRNILFQYSELLKRSIRIFQQNLGVEFSDFVTFESEIFYYDVRYATLVALHRSIEKSLHSEYINPDSIPFQVASFSELYQYWSLKAVGKALQDAIVGFVIKDMGEQDPFYSKALDGKIYCTFVHPQIADLEVKVWYEKIYSKCSERHNTGDTYGQMDDQSRWGNGRYNQKDRPDISLEFWHPSFMNGLFPLIITLDPTINKGSEWALGKKYGYLDSIRCFDPQKDRRGRARKLVKAAWAIYPGRNQNHPPIEPKGDDEQDHLEYSRGNLNLNPQNQAALAASLKEIIEYTVFHEMDLTF